LRSRIRKALAADRILLFFISRERICGRMDEVCVCMTAPRSYKHPRQGGVAPVDPNQREASPLSGLFPWQRGAGGINI
jgi:hypothetical protein